MSHEAIVAVLLQPSGICAARPANRKGLDFQGTPHAAAVLMAESSGIAPLPEIRNLTLERRSLPDSALTHSRLSQTVVPRPEKPLFPVARDRWVSMAPQKKTPACTRIFGSLRCPRWMRNGGPPGHTFHYRRACWGNISHCRGHCGCRWKYGEVHPGQRVGVKTFIVLRWRRT